MSENIEILVVYSAILLVVILAPILWDIKRSYDLKQKMIDKISSADPKVWEEVLKPIQGVVGLARLVMTLGIVIILGIAVFHLAVIGSSANEQLNSQQMDIVKNMMTILGGAVSAMIGFYFGQKSQSDPKPSTSPRPAG